MKLKKTIDETANSRTYRRLRNVIYSGCPICSPHKGCNRWKGRKVGRSWKEYRKTQWK
jgi:hypothetical protein